MTASPGVVRPLPVLVLSAAILGFELSLLRLLHVASWHHFVFLVISVAMLGFGASGTLLALTRTWIAPRGVTAFAWLSAGTAASMWLSATIALRLEIEARFVPALFWQSVAEWCLFWSLLTVPFLVGATAIGLAVMMAGERVGAVYAANLAGSGAGALLAPLVMHLVSAAWLPLPWTVAALVACLCVGAAPSRVRVWGVAGGAAVIVLAAVLLPPLVRLDPFKYGAHVEQLELQGSASLLARSDGPRGAIRVFRSDLFHDVPFLSGESAPPAIDALVIDGHLAGSILRVWRQEDAVVVDDTMMSLAYAFAPERPSVLLLDERGGIDIWLAARQGARSIRVVQPDPAVFALLRGTPSIEGGAVLDLPGVETVTADPRHEVERDGERFDLVQLAGHQTSLAGSGGIAALGEDFLVTVEGLAACISRLSPEGVLSVCRGIQTPARDNIKLLATAITALRRLGVERPGDHLVVARDFLAVCTMVFRSPLEAADLEKVRSVIDERDLTPVWYSGISPDSLNRPDELPGPDGAPGDWYHHATVRLLEDPQRFIDEWLFDVRPPTDDRPFFLDFCRVRSIGPLHDAFGDLWLTRAELGFLLVLAATALIAVAGLALTVLPLFLSRTVRRGRGKTVVAVYFASIGLAYLFLEMTALSRLHLVIGDPLHAAATTIATFLVVSGAGSAVAHRLGGNPRALQRTALLLAAVAIGATFLLGALTGVTSSWPLPARVLVSALAIAPLAFLAGVPMPSALARLDRGAPELVPWAWGVNGFASVLAAPLATALAMTWGFAVAGSCGAALYVVAACVFGGLPGYRRDDSSGSEETEESRKREE